MKREAPGIVKRIWHSKTAIRLKPKLLVTLLGVGAL